MTFSAPEKTRNLMMPGQLSTSIEIVTATFANPWPEWFCQKLLQYLANDDQKNILKFRRWQDRQLKLLGRALLLKALFRRGFPADILKIMTFSPHGKPTIAGGPEFNISHSGSRAVCALSEQGSVGIDIEMNRAIEPGDFLLALSPEEDLRLRTAPGKSKLFLELWTRKESACKAHGGGLRIDLKEVCPANGQAQINDQIFFLKEVNIAADYICAMATECPATSISLSHQLIAPEQAIIP